MTKYFELAWKIPVPQPLQDGAICDRWTEVVFLTPGSSEIRVDKVFSSLQEKETVDYEPDCTFVVDDCGFFISWKSDSRVKKGCKNITCFKSANCVTIQALALKSSTDALI